ncbi:hypothetical protein AVT69_gp258 [Pseudomonas phage PhiPA3]|uniref:Uncharacterized protein 260 n=1 Tax=Pseudomonas phage PhiPA3 TaxID=998086 RepID=F8SJ99_BPPA3|nr:hypothetical protein AVT69_gp258 [Pseudomonas phage PhiPA3]AEH03683.1 hypothetical protein [Pseudomonas phage PhiPA3]
MNGQCMYGTLMLKAWRLNLIKRLLKKLFRPVDPYAHYEKELKFLASCDPHGLIFNRWIVKVPLCALPYMTRVGKIFGPAVVTSIIAKVHNSPFRKEFFTDLANWLDSPTSIEVFNSGHYTDRAKAIHFASFLGGYWNDSTDQYLWYSQLRFGLSSMSAANAKIRVVTEDRFA